MAKREDMLAPVVYHHSLGIQGAGVPKKNLWMNSHFAGALVKR
jgi:hypothetical protein